MSSALWNHSRPNPQFFRRAILFSFAVVFFTCSVTATERKNNVYHCHSNDEMKIALTFDDGPHPILTPKILDILAQYHIKATFFAVGENVINYPNVVERIQKEGHELGNHTYTHDRIDKREIERCERAIYELTDYQTKLFRPPEGLINSVVLKTTCDLGYDIILWDIDTRDWDHTAPNEICNNVIKNIRVGSIILMHDYISYNSPTPEALEKMIPILLESGFKFVTVSELIGTGKYK